MKKEKKNNFSRKYISDVKALFPIYGKNEQHYLKQLTQHLTDYCEEVSVTSIDMLYEEFGTPKDTVNTYFSMMDTEQMISLIHMRKLKRHFFTGLLIILLIFFIFFSVILCNEHFSFMYSRSV